MQANVPRAEAICAVRVVTKIFHQHLYLTQLHSGAYNPLRHAGRLLSVPHQVKVGDGVLTASQLHDIRGCRQLSEFA